MEHRIGHKDNRTGTGIHLFESVKHGERGQWARVRHRQHDEHGNPVGDGSADRVGTTSGELVHEFERRRGDPLLSSSREESD